MCTVVSENEEGREQVQLCTYQSCVVQYIGLHIRRVVIMCDANTKWTDGPRIFDARMTEWHSEIYAGAVVATLSVETIVPITMTVIPFFICRYLAYYGQEEKTITQLSLGERMSTKIKLMKNTVFYFLLYLLRLIQE